MHNTQERILEAFEDEFKKGHTLLSIKHFPKKDEEIVKLENLEKEFVPYVYKTADLLSPAQYHERTLLYMYTEELIQLLRRVKEEEIINPSILNVLETLLLAMDYLTHERFITNRFEDRHKTKLFEILGDLFEEKKQHSFSEFANRPTLNKSDIYQNEDGAYCKDLREEKNRIYMVVVYKHPKNMMDHFKNVAHWLSQVNLKPNMSKDYQEMLEGKTEHQIYDDTLFYLNMVQRAFCWFLNSASWRNNELLGFDELDIRSKLGIR